MVATKFASVDQYIAAQPQKLRVTLRRVRAAIKKAVPAAEEMIGYQMPYYKLNGRPMLSFAGWREHLALYAANRRLLAAFEKELARYDIHKATIRFPLTKTVPVTLIARIARFRAKEIVTRTSARDS